MKKFILLSLCFLYVSFVSADPGWYSSDMKSSDCDGVFWKTQGMCFAEYNRQQLSKLKEFLREDIRNTRPGSCNIEEALKAFDDREQAWQEYSNSYCGLQMYCVGACGSGHSASSHSCNSSNLSQRLEFLKNEVKHGLEIWGCPVKGSTKVKILVTNSYKLSLEGECESGLFNCNKVTLNIHKSQGNDKTITMSGKTYSELNQDLHVNIQKGYTFENDSNLNYTISNEGILKITEIESNKLIVEEKGLWN